MRTPAQIAASIANGRRSRGPVTDGGKQRSAMNSLTHGLTAQRLLVPGESADEFVAFAAANLDLYRPVGDVEAGIVAEIISYSLRLRRSAAAESSAIRATIRDASKELNEPAPDPHDHLGRAFMLLDETGFLSRSLPRYEARLAQRRKEAMMLLFQLQRCRRQNEEEDALAMVISSGGNAETSSPGKLQEVGHLPAIAGATLPDVDHDDRERDQGDTETEQVQNEPAAPDGAAATTVERRAAPGM